MNRKIISTKKGTKGRNSRNSREDALIVLAEMHIHDHIASQAMKKLREHYDKTYGWCMDCDGLVVKEKDCCLNRGEN